MSTIRNMSPNADFSLHIDPVQTNIGLCFSPVEGRALEIDCRDAGLWALAARLAPSEHLCLTYRFGRSGRIPADVLVRLEGPVQVEGASHDRVPLRHTALERAACLALPGFSARDHTPDLDNCSVLLLPPAFDPDAVVGGRRLATSPAPVGSATAGPGSVLVPGRRTSRSALTRALGALAGLGIRADLSLSLQRFEVDAAMLRRLDISDAALCTRLYLMANDPAEALRLAYCHAHVRAWRQTRTGLRLEFRLGGPNHPDEDLCALISDILFGPAAQRSTLDSTSLDLSGSLPLEAPDRPALVPDPKALSILVRHDARQQRHATLDAIVIGYDSSDNPVAIGRSDCARHTYVIGATGVGKSTLIADMIAQDVAAGRAVILVDPHGDLFSDVRNALPAKVAERTTLADTGDFANPFGLNLLEITAEPTCIQRNFIANQLIGVFKSVLYRGTSDAFGPMFEAYFRNALLLLMEAESDTASLSDFDRVFGEPSYRRSLLERCEDPQVRRFWKDIACKAGGEASLENIAPYICSKLNQFTGNPLLRPIICARRTTLDIAGAMSRGEIVLVNLAKGMIGEHDASLLGALVTIRIFCAALARAALPPEKRLPVRLYLDEFSSYATGPLAQMLAEARKFGLELVLANQSLSQVDGRTGRPDVAHSILANVGSILAFRTGPDDAYRLADWFAPEIMPELLSRLPDHCLIARLLEGGVPKSPKRVWIRSPFG